MVNSIFRSLAKLILNRSNERFFIHIQLFDANTLCFIVKIICMRVKMLYDIYSVKYSKNRDGIC